MVRSSRCFYCGVKLTRKNKSTDHLVPISRGGNNKKKNKVNACLKCNTEKGCLSVEEFRAVMAYRFGEIEKLEFRFFGEVK